MERIPHKIAEKDKDALLKKLRKAIAKGWNSPVSKRKVQDIINSKTNKMQQ